MARAPAKRPSHEHDCMLTRRRRCHYYGAFVLDPDGHNIEAVCHEAE